MCDQCNDAFDDDAAWPLCAMPGCGEEVDPRRYWHITKRCLKHGSTARTVHIIDVPKSNPIVTTDLAFARGIGASHKGNRQVF